MKNINPVSNAHWLRYGTLMTLLFMSTPAFAVYDSGSDGSLGHLILNGDQTEVVIPLPPHGVLHYESIFIAEGVTVTFKANDDNTQVVMLATEGVVIDGTIKLNGKPAYKCNPPYKGIQWCGGDGGPGGFRGSDHNMYGQGPGGGQYQPSACNSSSSFCKPEWIILHGGSSGGRPAFVGSASGGGGGAITIASSGSITVNGLIQANGGALYSAGGKIRLVANTIGGDGLANAQNSTSTTVLGTIKFEAFLLTGTLAANTVSPPPYKAAVPQAAVPYTSNQRPQIIISKVDDQSVTGTSTFPPNVYLIQQKLITVEITTKYIPVGTIVKLAYRPNGSGKKITPCAPVTGTFESGTTTGTFTIAKNMTLGALQAWTDFIPIP
jgi:hypothetical protein